VVGIHFCFGFLLLPLLILGQPQLLAAALKIFDALRFYGRIDPRRETLDCDTRI
jgi:hypothetical protein